MKSQLFHQSLFLDFIMIINMIIVYSIYLSHYQKIYQFIFFLNRKTAKLIILYDIVVIADNLCHKKGNYKGRYQL